MDTWLVVWFIIGILTTVAVLAFLIALIRHLMVLGRSAQRMQDELSPIVREISADGSRASERAARMGPRR